MRGDLALNIRLPPMGIGDRRGGQTYPLRRTPVGRFLKCFPNQSRQLFWVPNPTISDYGRYMPYLFSTRQFSRSIGHDSAIDFFYVKNIYNRWIAVAANIKLLAFKTSSTQLSGFRRLSLFDDESEGMNESSPMLDSPSSWTFCDICVPDYCRSISGYYTMLVASRLVCGCSCLYHVVHCTQSEGTVPMMKHTTFYLLKAPSLSELLTCNFQARDSVLQNNHKVKTSFSLYNQHF